MSPSLSFISPSTVLSNCHWLNMLKHNIIYLIYYYCVRRVGKTTIIFLKINNFKTLYSISIIYMKYYICLNCIYCAINKIFILWLLGQ